MNILQIEDSLKGMPDDFLFREAQAPTGEYPQFLVVSEIQRRTQMRQKHDSLANNPEGTVKDQILQQGVSAVGRERQMQQPVPQQAPPQQMASGGHVRMANMGQVPSVYDPLIFEAANQYGLPPGLINNVIMTESNFDPMAVSYKGPGAGAGIMQLGGAHTVDPGYNMNPIPDEGRFDPAQAIPHGTEYLKNLQNEFGDVEHALVAYNWGPGNARRWIAAGAKREDLPAETAAYVDKIMTGLAQEDAAAYSRGPQGRGGPRGEDDMGMFTGALDAYGKLTNKLVTAPDRIARKMLGTGGIEQVAQTVLPESYEREVVAPERYAKNRAEDAARRAEVEGGIASLRGQQALEEGVDLANPTPGLTTTLNRNAPPMLPGISDGAAFAQNRDITVQGASEIQVQGTGKPNGANSAEQTEQTAYQRLLASLDAEPPSTPEYGDFADQARKDAYAAGMIQLGAGIAGGDLSSGISAAGREIMSGRQGARELEMKQRDLAYRAQMAEQAREDAVLSTLAKLDSDSQRDYINLQIQNGRDENTMLRFAMNLVEEMMKDVIVTDPAERQRMVMQQLRQVLPADLQEKIGLNAVAAAPAYDTSGIKIRQG